MSVNVNKCNMKVVLGFETQTQSPACISLYMRVNVNKCNMKVVLGFETQTQTTNATRDLRVLTAVLSTLGCSAPGLLDLFKS